MDAASKGMGASEVIAMARGGGGREEKQKDQKEEL
jgi:hypothetical protein